MICLLRSRVEKPRASPPRAVVLLAWAALFGAACSIEDDTLELGVRVQGDPTIMAQLSSVLVQTLDEDGAELLAYRTFSVHGDLAGSPPLSHSLKRPRDSRARIRVLALGRGLVDGVERTLIETQKILSVSGDASRQVDLYFSTDCFQRFCRAELRGSSLTCAQGKCVRIPDGDAMPPPVTADASTPDSGSHLDSGVGKDASSDAAPAVIVSMDSSTAANVSGPGDDGGCTPGSAGCACPNGAAPPCDVAPVDAGPGCDVGKHVGTFTGAVGPNMMSPNTSVTGTFSFEVPAGAQGSVAIAGSFDGKTPTGNTLVARVEGRWNCSLRTIEQGRLVAGVFTYVDRFLNDTLMFTGTVTGSYAPLASSVEGQWTVDSGNNAGGRGTWSARR
ncbi:MAG: hypothetical protein RLZZ450_988 [Pseudomonadota bacterium]|jgi:hypothetical protein